MRTKTTKQRFLEKVNVLGKKECWIWIGCRNRFGYGQFRLNNRLITSSRASWIIHFGPIVGKRKLSVCHSRDNPPCVNPDHLFLGTQSDNVNDSIRKGRRSFAVGEMIGIHKLTDERVRIMRSMYKTGEYTHRELASLFKIDKSNISRVLSGERWSHVL